MIIRPLNMTDFTDALALYRELMGDIPVAEDFSAFQKLLTHDGLTIWGAEVKGAIVSMVTLHVMPNITFGSRPYALIENVVTAQRAQGTGIGRAVMEAAMEAAWAENAYKIMLLTGQDSGAKGFYEKLGFTGDQKHGMIIRRAPQRRPIGSRL
ncbi:MAG: GNAT family N-acetyltransferase [Pikeienuella sp.]